MHVIVVGCGRVGSELAIRLQRDGHSVVIIDKNAAAFRRLPDGWGGEALAGTGIDRDILHSARVDEAGALAAVTSGDNTNILVARIARETFEIPQVVARIYDPRRAVIYQRLGIQTVATVSWTVDQVSRRLLPDHALTAWTDPTGEMSMVEHLLPDAFAGHRLEELASGDEFRPVLLTRAGQARLARHDTMGQEGDVVLFAVRTDAIEQLHGRLGIGSSVGGSGTGTSHAGADPDGSGGQRSASDGGDSIGPSGPGGPSGSGSSGGSGVVLGSPAEPRARR